ncbi:MAG: hypothetical protein NZ533_11520, partial [Casimicrobiaceae bacterium]|nr:hypothetical protein [Casimicrobiaceae bacterium]
PTPQRLLIPLTEEAAGAIRPLVVGAATGEEAVRVELMRDRLDRSRFALPPADSEGLARFQADGKALAARVAACRREAQRLLAAHALELTSDEPYEPWPQLLRLDAARIEGLRNGVLKRGAADPLADPSRWPLADLHRHVGGCLDLAAQQEVAAAIIKETPPEHVAAVTQALDLAWPDWAGARGTVGAPPDWPKRLRAVAEIVAPTLAIEVPRARAIASSLVLKRVATETLEGLLWNVTAPRIALKTRHPLGFAAYERPGELSGSALLGHPAAIDVYARAIVRAARAEGLIYLELRGSPHKYRPADPIGFLADFERALARADAQTRRMTRAEGRRLRVGFIWIIDRRDRSTAPAVIRQVVEARDRLPEFLLGLDLAGDEGTSDPEALARDFDPALRACIPVTIHAGEGEQADRIWQAAYHLHADRIGHGLTLPDHPALARRFRDRGIVLELCPTSNREVVGFCDPARPESAGLPAYPLAAMIHAGLPVTINTDNPAISRTTMADEYLVAARMVGEALLTPWRALALLRLAFRAAFVDAAERRVLEALAASHLLECARGGGAENAAPAPGAGSGDFGSLPP